GESAHAGLIASTWMIGLDRTVAFRGMRSKFHSTVSSHDGDHLAATALGSRGQGRALKGGSHDTAFGNHYVCSGRDVAVSQYWICDRPSWSHIQHRAESRQYGGIHL